MSMDESKIQAIQAALKEAGLVGKLNFSAPRPQGNTFGCQTVTVFPCDAWSVNQGQFLTSLACLPSYHRSEYSGNTHLQTPSMVWEITLLCH